MVRVIIVGGFKDAGKTSLLRRLGQHYAACGHVVGFVINEIGAVEITGDLLGFDAETKEITSACVTCHLHSTVRASVADMIERGRPDILMIEPKETISPLVIREEIRRMNFPADTEIDVRPLVTLIDAAGFKFRMKEKRKTAADQILVAEVAVISRTDLAGPYEADLAEASVRQINPAATVVRLSEKSDEGFDALLTILGISADGK